MELNGTGKKVLTFFFFFWELRHDEEHMRKKLFVRERAGDYSRFCCSDFFYVSLTFYSGCRCEKDE